MKMCIRDSYSTFRVRWQEAQPPFLYILFHPSADERAEGGAENDLEHVEPDERHYAGRKRRAEADAADRHIVQRSAGCLLYTSAFPSLRRSVRAS